MLAGFFGFSFFLVVLPSAVSGCSRDVSSGDGSSLTGMSPGVSRWWWCAVAAAAASLLRGVCAAHRLKADTFNLTAAAAAAATEAAAHAQSRSLHLQHHPG